MQRSFLFLLLTTLAGATLASGCLLSTRSRVAPNTHAPRPPAVSIPTGQAQPQLGQGVQIVEASCIQGAAEVCNGIDDNCDGQIDEGCGYSSGQVQITLAWNTGADLDVYVADPSTTNQPIYYQNNRSPAGGHLDQDARGACNPQQPNNTIENVYWENQAPPGQYRVEVHYWADGACSANNGPTTATLSVSIGGRVQTYNLQLSPDQRLPVVTFQL